MASRVHIAAVGELFSRFLHCQRWGGGILCSLEADVLFAETGYTDDIGCFLEKHARCALDNGFVDPLLVDEWSQYWERNMGAKLAICPYTFGVVNKKARVTSADYPFSKMPRLGSVLWALRKGGRWCHRRRVGGVQWYCKRLNWALQVAGEIRQICITMNAYAKLEMSQSVVVVQEKLWF